MMVFCAARRARQTKVGNVQVLLCSAGTAPMAARRRLRGRHGTAVCVHPALPVAPKTNEAGWVARSSPTRVLHAR
jgi:hypothetical protein